MKRMSLRKFIFICMLMPVCLSFICGSSAIARQTDQLKDEIFRESRESFQRAAEERVPFFSPNNFAKANEFYHRALDDFEKGERLRTIREHLNRANEYLETAFNTSRIVHVSLEGVMNTRRETIELTASVLMPNFKRPEYFNSRFLSERDFQDQQSYSLPKAENKYKSAILKIESGDLNSARSIAQDAEADYRSSAIMLLNDKVLGDADRRLQVVDKSIPQNDRTKAREELAELKRFLESQKGAKFSVGELSHEVRGRLLNIPATETQRDLPDVVTEQLTIQPDKPVSGEAISVGAIVRNAGRMPLEEIPLLLLGPDERELGRGLIHFLEPGRLEEISIPITLGIPGEFIITAVADPENLIAESNERNNEVSRKFVIGPGRENLKRVEPVVKYTEGRALEPHTRGITIPELPRDLVKKSKRWSEIFTLKYGEMIELKQGEKRDIPFQFSDASMIFIKIYSYGDGKDDAAVAAELYRGRQSQLLWSGKSLNLNNTTGLINEQVEISPEMLNVESTWTIKLINRANYSIVTEVWIGVSPRLQ